MLLWLAVRKMRVVLFLRLLKNSLSTLRFIVKNIFKLISLGAILLSSGELLSGVQCSRYRVTSLSYLYQYKKAQSISNPWRFEWANTINSALKKCTSKDAESACKALQKLYQKDVLRNDVPKNRASNDEGARSMHIRNLYSEDSDSNDDQIEKENNRLLSSISLSSDPSLSLDGNSKLKLRLLIVMIQNLQYRQMVVIGYY
jgi:uncharacterized protein (DUF2267 family)